SDEREAKFFYLGSTNGTLFNGRRIQAGEPGFVDGPVCLMIGKLELRFSQRVGDVASPLPPPPPFPPVRQGGFIPTEEWKAVPHPANPPPFEELRATHSPPLGARRPQVETPDAEPAGMGTAHVEIADVHQLVSRLRPSYENFRQG